LYYSARAIGELFLTGCSSEEFSSIFARLFSGCRKAVSFFGQIIGALLYLSMGQEVLGMKTRFFWAVLIGSLLAACASNPLRIAQEKTINVDGKVLKLSGSYNDKTHYLSLTINGDPVMQGKFPPFTPTQNFNAKYNEVALSSHCYFGSVLSSTGGAFGAIAGAVQAAKSSSGDKCEIMVNDKLQDTLYF